MVASFAGSTAGFPVDFAAAKEGNAVVVYTQKKKENDQI